jgi:Holliday junction resolvase|tara:strand:- start:382 stop:783 length:402 start_codon:yes stop_codon:yes gene_type:complete
MVNSRAKGAQFERSIANYLWDHLGIKFKRDLEQYREGDHGDLVPERGVDFPFVIECKRYKSGDGMRPDWWGQASRAANRAGKLPCVVYKFDHRDVRVVVPLHAVMYEEEDNGFVAVLDLEGFCYLVREMMNEV